MAISSLLNNTLLLAVVCITVAVFEGASAQNSLVDKTYDSMTLQQSIVQISSSSTSFFPNPKGNLALPDARKTYLAMLEVVELKEKVRRFQSSPIVDTLSLLLDSIINNICIHVKSEFGLSDADMDCSSPSSINMLKELKSQLLLVNQTLQVYSDLKDNRAELELNTTNRIGRGCSYWKKNLLEPCRADQSCSAEEQCRLFKERNPNTRCHRSACEQ